MRGQAAGREHVRQAVDALVQRSKGQPALALDQRDRGGIDPGAGGEQAADRGATGVQAAGIGTECLGTCA
jgi:hypothetical protein